ncbi:MAG: hypothetical protein Faunusvirus5_12 [Faunusvirus sp.]|jgi:hypothetical protein|uniref:Uncharacterized protein n=1 Tax=Faunusvirus sp. TaxID=2487766 RepID=A0A3G5A041_9VIRU|nr:MAG: hypothetical protein Faunusvirus5_12 [Faunusvirus sp.]
MSGIVQKSKLLSDKYDLLNKKIGNINELIIDVATIKNQMSDITNYRPVYIYCFVDMTNDVFMFTQQDYELIYKYYIIKCNDHIYPDDDRDDIIRLIKSYNNCHQLAMWLSAHSYLNKYHLHDMCITDKITKFIFEKKIDEVWYIYDIRTYLDQYTEFNMFIKNSNASDIKYYIKIVVRDIWD